MAVVRSAARCHHQETGRVPRPCRPQRDPLLRQIEVEEIDAHARPVRSVATPPAQAASAITFIDTILSGSLTGSPRLILSTISIPSTTLPHTVYCRSSQGESAKQMKN